LCEKTILVPRHAVGKVIGKGGTRIATLAKTHSCELRLLRDEVLPNGDTPLRIQSVAGDCMDLLALERDVNEIVSEEEF
jgi:predicted PilT family ATPase